MGCVLSSQPRVQSTLSYWTVPCLSFALSIRQHLPCSLDNLFHNRDVIITRNNNDNTLFTTPFEVTGYYCFIISLFRYHQYSCFNQEPFDDRDSPIVSYHLPLVIRAHTPAISNSGQSIHPLPITRVPSAEILRRSFLRPS